MSLLEEHIKKFRQDVRPTIKCYRPVRIFNRNSGMFEYHNCGKCPYCLFLRSQVLTQRCFAESKQHKYALFFTLTYDNEHLPYIERLGKWFVLRNRTVVIDGECVPIVHYSEFEYDKMRKIETADGPVDVDAYGVLFNKDIIDFKKRLRINISRSLNGFKYSKDPFSAYQVRERQIDVRIFINGEYGPTTLRPHYHGIIWTDSSEVANLLTDPFRGSIMQDKYPDSFHGLIYKAWQMCSPSRCDVQHVVQSASSYCASYVASVASLPKVLQSKPFRPKVLASKNPIIGSYKVDFEAVQKMLFDGIISYKQFDDETRDFTDVPLPYSYLLRYFPKCAEYGVPSDYDKLRLFEKYRSSKYVRRRCEPRGQFDRRKLDRVCLNDNLDYLDLPCNDYFRPQNLRWYRLVDFWCFRPLSDAQIVSASSRLCEPVGRFLRPIQYIRLCRLLYEEFDKLQLAKFYSEQEVIADANILTNNTNKQLYYISLYPEFAHNLPKVLGNNAQRIVVNNHLRSFGLCVNDIYEGDSLVYGITDFWKNNSIVSTHRVSTDYRIKDKNKSKKFKEYYARQKGIIY